MDFSDVVSRAAQASPDDLPAVLAALADGVGLGRLRLYVIDYGRSELEAVNSGSERLALASTPAGRAFTTGQVVAGPSGELWVPVVERHEALGVLSVEPTSDVPMGELMGLGRAAGALIRMAGGYTDRFEMHRHRADMSLAAEMQWELLPPLAFSRPGVSIHGILEPAYEIGGDAFDYSDNTGVVQAAIFDAMGHGLEATQMVSLALGAYRYSRRKQMTLEETATTIDVAISHLHGGERFVTGQLIQLDLSDRTLRWINAGHPEPMLLRAGQMIAEPHVEPSVPFGLGTSNIMIGRLALRAGDRLLLATDGAEEARPTDGEPFGRPRLFAAVERELAGEQNPHGLLQGLIGAVLAHRLGDLEDDVTFVLVTIEP